jgi:integrase
MDKEEGDPDPLTPTETAIVLDHIKAKYGVRQWAWAAFAFATGLRPSEQCVLLHSDIVSSATGDRASVTKAQDLDGSVKPTKTKGKRLVDLAPLALEAIAVSKSFMNHGGEIFQNPITSQPWRGNRSQHETIWTPTLKKLDIAPRRAYCTRHTFATTLLAHGARVAYVSSQMGHTSPSMVEKTYAKWLPDGDGGHSRAILAGAFA